MRQKIFVIAHTVDGSDLYVDYFYSNEKAIKHAGDVLCGGEYDRELPGPGEDVEEFIQEYYEWVREENDNECEVDIVIKTFEV